MQELARLRDRDKRIWELLVKYANAREGPDVNDFLILLPGSASVGLIPLSACLQIQSPLHSARRSRKPMKAEPRNQLWPVIITRMLGGYSSGSRIRSTQVQTWPFTALSFLRKGIDGIKRVFDVNEMFDPDRRSAAFYVETPIEFPFIVSPVCVFIWRQLERYREGDGELKELVPLGRCKRCGNFFLAERVRRKAFCSDKCRSGFSRAHTDADQKAEQMRKYRAGLKEIQSKRTQTATKDKKGK